MLPRLVPGSDSQVEPSSSFTKCQLSAVDALTTVHAAVLAYTLGLHCCRYIRYAAVPPFTMSATSGTLIPVGYFHVQLSRAWLLPVCKAKLGQYCVA